MKKTIQYLLLTSCFLFAVSYDSYTLGVDYDKRYKLSPEYESSSCLINLNYYSYSHSSSYGKRWERLGFISFSAGTILIISTFIAWRRKKQREEKSILDLVQEE